MFFNDFLFLLELEMFLLLATKDPFNKAEDHLVLLLCFCLLGCQMRVGTRGVIYFQSSAMYGAVADVWNT